MKGRYNATFDGGADFKFGKLGCVLIVIIPEPGTITEMKTIFGKPEALENLAATFRHGRART